MSTFAELVTARRISDETSLSLTQVRSILRHASEDGVKPINSPFRTKLWVRSDIAQYFATREAS